MEIKKPPRENKKGGRENISPCITGPLPVTRASRSFIMPRVGIGIETRGLGVGNASREAGAGRARGAKKGAGEKIPPPGK